MRKPFICGNWKLNLRLPETKKLISDILVALPSNERLDVVVAPVATVLFAACEEVKGSPLKVAAQNVFYKDQGAYTGEWSVEHLLELGCSYAIVGHSERRQYFNETNTTVAAKVATCLRGRLVPIVCIGESGRERAEGRTEEVLASQLMPVLDALEEQGNDEWVLAYEPVWAIGTGNHASLLDAGQAHRFLRSILQQKLGGQAERIRIIYGGSVNPSNAAELMADPHIDGTLVGGASLQADSFLAIIDAAIRAK